MQFSGGSGVFDLELDGDSVSLASGRLLGLAPGRSTVTATDHFLGLTSTVTVDVVPVVSPEPVRDSVLGILGRWVRTGDVNQDGYDDALFMNRVGSLGAYQSGVGFLYAGGPSGLSVEPVQQFSGRLRYDVMGEAAVGDFDGDGLVDLVLAAYGSDLAGSSAGALYVHRGTPSGWFDETPWKVIEGERGGYELGRAVTACDVNRDGVDDIVAVARQAYTQSSGYREGALHVFLGGASGLPDKPSFARYGALPGAEAPWDAISRVQYSYEVAAGDVDGDGRCDVAVAADVFHVDGGSADEIVVVHRGTDTDSLWLEEQPFVGIGDITDSYRDTTFGRRIALGDVDGDGADDLLIGHYNSRRTGGSDRGAAWLYLGASLDERPLPDLLWPEDAAWSVQGDNNTDYLGGDVDLFDIDGDGLADVLVGASRDETDSELSPLDGGVVWAWSGADVQTTISSGGEGADTPVLGAWFDPEAERYSYFGQAARAVGDADGDGITDIVVHHGRSNTDGIQTGRNVFINGSGVLAELDYPSDASGHEFGRGLALVDANDDGVPEVYAGSPGEGFEGGPGASAGVVRRLAASGTEFDLELGGHDQHSANDRQGQAVSTAGDFDGDGFEDLLVVSSSDSRPSNLHTRSGYVDLDEGCATGSGSSRGSARIYRGSAAGVATEPSFVIYGQENSRQLFLAAGDFDFDGDGRSDVVLGSYRRNGDRGGVFVVNGRDAPEDGLTGRICDVTEVKATNAADTFGRSLAVAGDLDGDGCDELVVGADQDDVVSSASGVVWVLWGWAEGHASCRTAPVATGLRGIRSGARAGSAVAGGGDFDGDGIPDLAVGARTLQAAGSTVGGAFVVPGSWVVGRPTVDIVNDRVPATSINNTSPLVPPSGRWGLDGTTVSGNFGWGLSFVQDPNNSERVVLAVAEPTGHVGVWSHGGGVHLHRYGIDSGGVPGVEDEPFAVLAGLSAGRGEAGASMVSRGTQLLVGAPWAEVDAQEVGALVLVDLVGGVP